MPTKYPATDQAIYTASLQGNTSMYKYVRSYIHFINSKETDDI